MDIPVLNTGLALKLKHAGLQPADISTINDIYKATIRNIIPAGIPINDSISEPRKGDVIQWTINYSLGKEGTPQFNVIDVGRTPPIVFRDGTPFEIVGPIATPLLGTNVMTTMLMKYGIQKLTKLDTTFSEQPRKIHPELHDFPQEFVTLDTTFSEQQQWDIHPELYKVPQGFPRNTAEKKLSYNTTVLLERFSNNANIISKYMATEIKRSAPQWKLPDPTGVDFNVESQRFAFLQDCDASLTVADVESRNIMSQTLKTLASEGADFLVATTTNINSNQTLFHDYFSGQLDYVVDTNNQIQSYYINYQTQAVNKLKTDLSKLDYDNEKAQNAAAQAKKNENHSCSDIFAQPIFWIVVLFAPALLVLVLMGGHADQYPPPSTDPDHRGDYAPNPM